MKTQWPTVRLGDVLELKRGYDLPKQKRTSGTVPIISSSGHSGFHNEAKAKAPGVVTGRYGTLGNVYFLTEDFWPLNTTLYVRDFKGNDPKFINYFLKTVDFLSCSDKAAVPGLNRNHLHELNVNIPPIEEQLRIAHILGALDDKIDLNRCMNETLEATAHAIFQSWFVDFDPVRTKAEGRHPFGMDSETVALFPERFEESIPKGWNISSFADTVEILGGGTPKTSVSEYWDGDIPWFSVADAPIDGDVFVIDTAKKITKEGLEASSTTLLPKGTTIVTARGTVGKVALVGTPMAMNQSCYGLQGKNESLGLFTYFATRALVSTLKQHAHGSVFDTITRNTLVGVSIIMPPSAVIAAFEKLVAPLFDRIHSNLFESRTLTALRDSLLPKLMSGELTPALVAI